MADFDSLVSQYLDAYGVGEMKKSQVAATAEAKKATVGGALSPTNAYSIGAGVYSGKGNLSAGPLEQDIRNLSPLELAQKYGDSAATEMIAAKTQGMENYRRDASSSQPGSTRDAALSIGSGFVNGFAGIGALGVGGAEKLGLAPDGSGAYVAGKIADANNWVQSKQTSTLNMHRQAVDALQNLDERDHQAQFEEQKKTDGAFIAGLTKIGRDALSSVKNTGGDTELLTDGLSNGLGSLFVGGIIGKGLGLAGDAAAARFAVGAAGPSKVGVMIAKATEKAAIPIAIGGQEAGGTYQQTADQAIKMGATPTEANDAGLIAAGIQAPVSVAAGSLVSKFVEHPLKVTSVGEAVGNLIKEPIEEGIQSGSSQLAQNAALKGVVDPNQDLTEGVGAQIGQGAMFGLGTAGVVQAPGLAAHGAVAAAQPLIKTAAEAGKAIMARGEKISAGINAAQTQKATDAQNALVAAAPEMQQQIKDAIQAKGLSPEETAQQVDHVDRLFSRMGFDPTEAQNEAPVIQSAVQGATDRFTALRQVAQVANDPKTSETDRVQAGAYLEKQYNQYEELLVKDMTEAIKQVDDSEGSTDPNLQHLPRLYDFQDTVLALREHPEIKAALAKAQDALASQQVQDQFSEKALSTEQGQQNAQKMADTVVQLTLLDPEKADPKTLDVIRTHAEDGRLNLTPEQVGILKSAYSLIQATKDIQDQKKALGLSYADQVTNDIQTRDGKPDSTKLSARQHAKGVLDALRVGDRDLAAVRLKDFMLFAEHMQNKVEALNASAVSGTNEPYSALSPNRDPGQAKWFKETKGLGLKLQNQSSVEFAQKAALDARAVAKLANGVAEAFPDFKVQSVTPVSLKVDPNLERTAADIVEEHRNARKTTSQEDVNSDKTAKEGPDKGAQTPSDTTQNEEVATKSATELDPKQQPLPFEKPVEPLKEPEQPVLPLASDEQKKVAAEDTPKSEPVAAPETPVVVEQFPDLLGSKEGKNWFKKAFSFPEEAKSRLVDLGDQVIVKVTGALKSSAAYKAFMGTDPKHDLNRELLDAYEAVLSMAPEIQSRMEAQLEAFLAKTEINKNPDNPVQTWGEGKALNITEVREDGSIGYNQQLLQSAILAGLQWVVSTQGRPARNMTVEDVAEILNIEQTQVDPDLVDLFRNGTRIEDAKQALARTILRFWGVETNDRTPDAFTKGIPESLAAELIWTMSNNGMSILDVTAADVMTGKAEEAHPKTFQWVSLGKGKDEGKANKAVVDTLSAFPDAIERLAVKNPEETRFINEPPTDVSPTQLRNRAVRLTPSQVKMVEKEQKTPHKLNKSVVDFYEQLGLDLVRELFGAGKIDEEREKKLNVNHAKSLKGKNATVEGAFQALTGVLAEVRSVAKQAGLDPHDTPIFYRYGVSKVGRLQMLGAHSPQASKLVREAILPTRSTLDLNDPKNLEKFRLAVAQAWGVKVHKQTRPLIAAEAHKLAGGDYAPALEIFDRSLNGKPMTAEDVQALKTIFGKNLSPAAVHAGLEMARYLQASEADRAKFQTHLYVEADGMTDGPINALYHLATGAFSARWVQLMAKGGLFLGSMGMTANAFISRPGDAESKKDFYEATSDKLQEILRRNRQGMSPQVAKLAGQLDSLMAILLPDAKLNDDGELVLDRGIVKNPLTVTIYGAGIKGISEKVVGAITDKFYEELSKALNDEPNEARLVGDLIETLSRTGIIKDSKTGEEKVITVPTEMPARSSARDFTLSKAQEKNLTDNLRKLFVQPMAEAVESSISDTTDGRETLRQAVQVQSIFAQYAFTKAIEAALAAKPEGERKNFLSQFELNKILEDLKKKFPLIQTNEQALFPAGTDSSEILKSETIDPKTKKARKNYYQFSSTLDGKLNSNSRVYGPSDVGVGGIPYTVINFGDGLMMQLLSTQQDSPEGKLLVFDGVHIKLDTLNEDGVKVNQAVYDAWQNNPLSAVNEAFQGFLTNASFDAMPIKMREALTKALTNEKEPLSVADIQAEMRSLGNQMQRAAEQSLARHRALARVEMSVDHMSSIEAPFLAQGEGKISLEGKTEVEIAHLLTGLYEEELAKIRAEKPKAGVKAVAEESALLPPATAPVPATVIPANRLLKTVRGLKLPAEQKNLLLEVTKSLQKSGWEIVYATREQADAMTLERGLEPIKTKGQVIHGYADFRQDRIFLHTDAPETLLHELLHAAATRRILDHYHGQTSPEIAEHIQNLEALLSQWMDLENGQADLPVEQRGAYRNALRQVRANLNNADRSSAENKAAALDEFLAWNLSNQELIKLAQGTKVETPFARVVKRVLVALKNLIWGRNNGPMVRSDMYSSMRFNASGLINATPTLQSRAANLTRSQSIAYGNSDRLSDLQDKINKMIHNHLPELGQYDRKIVEPEIIRISDQVASAFADNGFSMNPQERTVFASLVAVFATRAKLDPASLARVQEIYNHLNRTLEIKNFMADPDSLDPNMQALAQARLQLLKGYVNGASIVQTDIYGRSTLMSAFLALAMVNSDFREVLSKLAPPKGKRESNDNLDGVLNNVGASLMDQLSVLLSGEGRNSPNIRAAIDGLLGRLTETVESQENGFTQLADTMGRGINGLNDKMVEGMQKGSKAAIDRLESVKQQTNSKLAKGALEFAKGIASIVNEQEAKILSEAWLSTANQMKLFAPLHDLLNDLIGRTDSNATVYDLIKQVRSVVQQMRQQFREHPPGLIAQRFTRELSGKEWGHLFQGLAKTDLASLRQSFSLKEILDLVKDQGKQDTEIQRLEQLIEGEVGPQNWKLMQGKARQLATFLNTGVIGSHFLRNAVAVANLHGVAGVKAFTPSKDLVGRVDQLVSLYALKGIDPSAKQTLSELVQKEADGLSFTLSYLVGQRAAEQGKLASPEARLNHYKGYIPSEPKAGGQLIIAKDDEEARLRLLGYKRVGDYKGSSAEFGAIRRGYYFAPVSSRALYQQGIMQNIRQTASGVDPVTGMTHDGLMTAGYITDPSTVQKISRRMGHEQGTPLMPIFGEAGKIVAYERSVDPVQEQRLGRDQHLARMIGAWRGRQAEEGLAGQFNQLLVSALHDVWSKDRNTARKGEYVDLTDPAELKKDPVLADAVKLFTPDAWEHIRDVFGDEGFMVRRDMLNDAIGYRSASVGDLWTGNTRLNPEAVKVARNIAIGVFGADAYRNLVTAEKLVQNVVSEVRQLIVVKSVVVPVSNFIANIYQMSSRGVGLGRIAKDIPKKLVEVNAYIARRTRQIELEAELRAAENNVVASRKIEVELQSIRDANKRMSIWPLIEAGEFSSISDAGSLDKEETTLFEGKLTEYIESKVNKLPPLMKTAGRYALITQDTALFQGMQRAMEYGDFLAKAIRYDHLVEEKKMDPKEALGKITEEYVNYDRLSGRFRQGLENLGLLWFWNFKVRIAKIAVATLRENPLHALLTALVPTPNFVGSIGTPLSDNLFTMLADGGLGWSIGPGMGLRAYDMNPWLNILR